MKDNFCITNEYSIIRKGSFTIETAFFGSENLGTQTNVGKEVQVTYDLDTISSYGNLSWHLRTEGKSAVINPVKHIRRLRAAQAVLREMGE